MHRRGYCFKSGQQIKPQLKREFLECQKKSLVMSNGIESLMNNYQFEKPTVHIEASKTVNAFEKLHALQTSRPNMLTNHPWILLRLL